MADQAHEWTDERLEELVTKLHETYLQASFEMSDKLAEWMKEYESQNAAWQKAVKIGFAKQEDYDAWLEDRLQEKLWQQDMVDMLVTESINADMRARQLINDEVPTIYSENANWAAYSVDHQAGLDTGFTLYNQDTVRMLIADDPQLLPRLDVQKSAKWSRQKLTSAITQSILQGESIPKATQRIKMVLGISERSAEAVARTAITYAESQGRLRSFRRAESMGIPLKKVWHAHIDGRTRLAHRQADGQTVAVNEPFIVDGHKMDGPGDPSAPGHLMWNCRCNPVTKVDRDGIPPAVVRRHQKLPKDVSYDEWKQGTYRTNRFYEETDDSKRERGVE